MYQKFVCAGKVFHETFDLVNEGVDRYLQLMSGLHHPNIIDFLGVCYLPGHQLPMLVMERLEASLHDLLEHIPKLPLSFKRSVLEDIASGLLYLHNMRHSIVHGNLTSNNVLLTSSLVAKITDVMDSRITHQLPTKLEHMPPEAEFDNSPSLDIFSFGHLALYAITQVRSSSI